MNDLIVPPQHREAHANGLKRYLQTGTGPVLDNRIEITALDKAGREFPVELSITETDYLGERAFIGFLEIDPSASVLKSRCVKAKQGLKQLTITRS